MIEGLVLTLIFGGLPLAVIAGAIAAGIAVRRAAEVEGMPDDPGIGSVRRLFIYALALVGAIFAAIGLAMIVSGAIDAVTAGTLLNEQRRGLAVALAFTVVGAPAWLLFMRLAQRSVAAHEVERRSQARRLYFAVARTVGLALVAWNAVLALRILLLVDPVAGGPFGALVAWGGLWLLHARLTAAEPAPTIMTRFIDRLAGAFAALLGLLMVLGGAIQLLAAPLSEAYDRVFRGSLLSAGWDRDLRSAIALLAVGAAIWIGAWVRGSAVRDRGTTLWRVHVFLFGALLGVALAIVPAAMVAYAILEWRLGVPRAETAAAQFALVPGALATSLVGVGTWGYHRAVIGDAGAAEERSGPERVYRYVLAAAGLVTLAIGVSTWIALGAEGLAGRSADYVVSAGWWRNPLLTGAVLLAFGLPLWARAWFATQRALDAEASAVAGTDERLALSRRVSVFGTVGVAVFALLVSLTILLYQVFQAVLAAEVSLAVLREARWAIATAATAGVIAYYHLLVLREDQAAQAARPVAAPPRARLVTLLAGDVDRDLRRAIETIPGVRLRLWRADDGGSGALPAERRDALRAAILAAPAERLLVTLRDGQFEVTGYAETPEA